MSIADDLQAAGVGIAHHFGGGAYIKETDIPRGASLAQHVHDHDHLSYLVRGQVTLTVDDKSFVMTGPTCILMEAHKAHSVTAITDALWLCVWATDCTDPDKVDGVLTGGE